MSAKVRIGNQHPTFEVRAEYDHSDGDRAVSLYGEYGVSFYPAQEHELRLFLARDSLGRYSFRTIGISKPRQNGKSYAARFYALWMAGVEGRTVLYTAHHGSTTRKMFEFMRDFVTAHEDWIKALKPGRKGIYSAEGREGIYFANGGKIEFMTRTTQGGRGGTHDVIIIDEAQELTDEQFDALIPSTIASDSGDPQKIFIGTPPNAKCPGTVFRSHHKKAHAGTGGNLCWLEWAAETLGDVHDKEIWYATNPALGLRINEDVFADAADSASSIDGFFREYLGWWEPAEVASAALDARAWASCACSNPPQEGIVSCGVKFSLDGKRAALSVCIKPEDGKPHIETICTRSTVRGVGWFEKWIVERKKMLAQVTIDGKSKASTLEKKLSDAKFAKKQVVVTKSTNITDACSMLEEAIASQAITHFAQPGLDESATRSIKRDVGKAGGWAFDGEFSLPIESAALAYWGSMTTKRKPNRKARVG